MKMMRNKQRKEINNKALNNSGAILRTVENRA